MIRLYTAVGRFELQKDGNGRKQPIVIVNQKESALSREEMVLWSCLMWNIMTKEEVGESYEKKVLQVGLEPSRFEAVLQRMETRHLIISAEAEKGDSALYRLLANLYVVPIRSSFFVKVQAFLRLLFLEGVPFSTAKILFRSEQHTDMERKVLHLASQTYLSCAEILKCIAEGVTDVSSSEKVLKALYDDDYSTCDNLGWFMQFYDNHRQILEAISMLYLNRNVIFDRWY